LYYDKDVMVVAFQHIWSLCTISVIFITLRVPAWDKKVKQKLKLLRRKMVVNLVKV